MRKVNNLTIIHFRYEVQIPVQLERGFITDSMLAMLQVTGSFEENFISATSTKSTSDEL